MCVIWESRPLDHVLVCC